MISPWRGFGANPLVHDKTVESLLTPVLWHTGWDAPMSFTYAANKAVKMSPR